MTGGTTKQNTSYSSGVNFAPVVSGNVSVHNGDIRTGASGGNTSASAGGAGVSLGVSVPALMNLSSNDRIIGSHDSIHNGNNDRIIGVDRHINGQSGKTDIGVGRVGVRFILI